MQLICPHCGYTRELEPEAVPPQAVQVTCPRCKGTFRFDPAQKMPEKMKGQTQIFTAAEQDEAPPAEDSASDIRSATAGEPCAAGFWIRAVAALFDSLVSSALQFGMAFALGTITEISGSATLPLVQMLIMLFSTLAGIFYYVFFTGYSGQTPGKMLLRIRVVRLDNTQVSYGQAFIRETIGKFISGIVLGIGYLMAALRSDKRALHDLMADTKVVKI